jgi:2-succinyl-6-hydroxy-2,4-cyclohexadiene-1-carboxylate synthase
MMIENGSGPGELWCLHGAVGCAADWQGLAPAGWRRRAVDLWRLLECRALSLDEAARAINAEAARAGGAPVLLGYSLGGRLALHCLLQPARPWAAAMIVAAHPGLEDAAERAQRRAGDAEWAALAGTDWEGFLAKWAAQPVLAGVPMPDRSALRVRQREIARSFIAWSLGAQEPLWQGLGRIRVPVWWVAGGKDPKFSALAQRAAALTPRGTCHVIENAGHRLPWEAPREFGGLLAEFLERMAG